MAISNGIFAWLFVALLVYELKDSRTREKKYQKTIDSLANRLQTVEKISEDIMALPMSAFLSPEDQQKVIEVINKATAW